MSIAGNARDDLKRRLWSEYQDVVRRRAGRFAHSIAARVAIVDATVDARSGATVVCECRVEQGAEAAWLAPGAR